jgi:hypothetical protein
LQSLGLGAVMRLLASLPSCSPPSASPRSAEAQLTFQLRTGDSATNVQSMPIDSNNCAGSGPRAMYVGGLITNTGATTVNNIVATISGVAGNFALGQRDPVGRLARRGQSTGVYWHVDYGCSITTVTSTIAITSSAAAVSRTVGLSTKSVRSAPMPAATSSPRRSAPARWSARPSISTPPTISAAPTSATSSSSSLGQPALRRRLLPPRRHRDSRQQHHSDRRRNAQQDLLPADAEAVGQRLFRHGPLLFRISVRRSFDDGPALCDDDVGQLAQIYRQLRRLGQRQHQLPGRDQPVHDQQDVGHQQRHRRHRRDREIYDHGLQPVRLCEPHLAVRRHLPAGAKFLALDAASNVTAANSSSVPAANATGTLTFTGRQDQSYLIAAGGTVKLIYTVQMPSTAGTYANSARAVFGTATTRR